MKEWLKQFYGEHKWLTILAAAALVLGILFLCSDVFYVKG